MPTLRQLMINEIKKDGNYDTEWVNVVRPQGLDPSYKDYLETLTDKALYDSFLRVLCSISRHNTLVYKPN